MFIRSLFLALFLLTTQIVTAQLRLPLVLNDNMVVQRDQAITVWGWATPQTNLTVEMNEQQVMAQTDLDGKWQVDLPAMPAGGPYEMMISTETEKKVLTNVMVGDVWLCSGQSNMEWQMKNSDDFVEAVAAANQFPNIRHFKVPRTSSLLPVDTLTGGDWQNGSAATIGDFTAVGYFFAKKMQQRNPKIAIGLLHSSWGGSRIEPWMNAQTLGFENAEQQAELTKQAALEKQRQQRRQIKKVFAELPKEDLGMKGETAAWADMDLNTEDWKLMRLPQLWEDYGEGYLKDLDGTVWFRKVVVLTEGQAAQDATLYAGKIDDSDYTYVNGKLVGSMIDSYNAQREYIVPAAVLLAGANVITIRVVDNGGGGGIYGEKAGFQLVTAQGTVSLAGNWKFNLGKYRSELFGFSANKRPTLLYNAMIRPIQNYKIKGALWYQGESNAGSAEEAFLYREHLPNLIRQWRSEWNSGEFPFLYVSLANFMPADKQPTNSNWALIRESMTKTLSVPKTGEAIIIDAGEAGDIHPRDKKTVGERLAIAALHYANPAEKMVWQSPQFSNMEIRDGKVIVNFDAFGSSINVRDKYGYVKGFAIAGKDKKFHWAQAKMENGKIVVWSNTVEQPVAVRYAWSDNPDDANLFNTEGLPVTPFRTDKW